MLHSQNYPSSVTVFAEKIGISAGCRECSIWSLTVQIHWEAISAGKWEGSDLWSPSTMILICQSGNKSEIRTSGLQVKRHTEVRCSPGGEGEEVKESMTARVSWWKERICRVQIAGEWRRRIWRWWLMKKHMWVMKERVWRRGSMFDSHQEKVGEWERGGGGGGNGKRALNVFSVYSNFTSQWTVNVNVISTQAIFHRLRKMCSAFVLFLFLSFF